MLGIEGASPSLIPPPTPLVKTSSWSPNISKKKEFEIFFKNSGRGRVGLKKVELPDSFTVGTTRLIWLYFKN